MRPIYGWGMDLGDMRQGYERGALDESMVRATPFLQFAAWFDEARAAEPIDANAMTLATATPDGEPAARVVLLKEVDENGFVFFTNYDSQKGRELTVNPRAALCFHWRALERQVRVSGAVERVSEAESAAYFAARPRGSRLAAWASPQSERLADRDQLEARLAQVETRFPDDDVPLPPFWGGFRVRPWAVEFWQGRPNRLHDRLRYVVDGAAKSGWRLERLAP